MASKYEIIIRKDYTKEESKQWITSAMTDDMNVLLEITQLNQQPIGLTITPSVPSLEVFRKIARFLKRHTFSNEEDIIKVVNSIIEGKKIREPVFSWCGTRD